jgi:hypothetical protein
MLTTTQLQALKVDILADQALAPLFDGGTDNAFAIAEAYNQPHAGGYLVWRTYVDVEEIMGNGFVWTVVDTLAVGKARIWEWLTRFGWINPSKANVRQGIADAFGNNSAMTNAVAVHCKRVATRAERLFATGAGTSNNPGIMAFEGEVTYQDVLEARSA